MKLSGRIPLVFSLLAMGIASLEMVVPLATIAILICILVTLKM